MFLCNICHNLDSRKWILPCSMQASNNNTELCFEKNLSYLKKIFTHLKDFMQSKLNCQYCKYSTKVFSHSLLMSSEFPNILGQYLFISKYDRDCQKKFILIMQCMCSTFSDAFSGAFSEITFCQMYIVQKDRKNRLNKENIIISLCIRIIYPALKAFQPTDCISVVSCSYNNKN